MTTAIEIAHISRSFNHQVVLNDVSLDVQPCELLALLGPSGSGKTTLLRLIAGLDTPDKGHITIGEDNATTRRPTERGVGFVFQKRSYAETARNAETQSQPRAPWGDARQRHHHRWLSALPLVHPTPRSTAARWFCQTQRAPAKPATRRGEPLKRPR